MSRITLTNPIINVFTKINLRNYTLKHKNVKFSPFSSSTAIDTSFPNTSSTKEKTLSSNKTKLLKESLDHVAELGWTEEAIYKALSNNKSLPITTMGLLSNNPSNDLITHYMDTCNQELQSELDFEDIPVNVQIEKAIRMRLSKNIKYIQSQRWHEAMANGILHNPTMTINQLNDIVSIIINATNLNNHVKERIAIGIVYITTELYMLTDKSMGYEDTWRFLNSQMQQLDYFKNVGFVPSYDTLVVTGAIISSIGGAVASLAGGSVFRGVSSGSVISLIMGFAQQQQSKPNDYNTGNFKYYNEKYYGDLKDVDTTKETK